MFCNAKCVVIFLFPTTSLQLMKVYVHLTIRHIHTHIARIYMYTGIESGWGGGGQGRHVPPPFYWGGGGNDMFVPHHF